MFHSAETKEKHPFLSDCFLFLFLLLLMMLLLSLLAEVVVVVVVEMAMVHCMNGLRLRHTK